MDTSASIGHKHKWDHSDCTDIGIRCFILYEEKSWKVFNSWAELSVVTIVRGAQGSLHMTWTTQSFAAFFGR